MSISGTCKPENDENSKRRKFDVNFASISKGFQVSRVSSLENQKNFKIWISGF